MANETEQSSLHNGVMIGAILAACKNEAYVMEEDGKTKIVDARTYARTLAGMAEWMAINHPQLFTGIATYLEFATCKTAPEVVSKFYEGRLRVVNTAGDDEHTYMKQIIHIDEFTTGEIDYSSRTGQNITIRFKGNVQEKRYCESFSTVCNLVEKFAVEKIEVPG